MDKKVKKLVVKQMSKSARGAKRAAFSLPEVLITLGIIGVVAAMTLPMLKNYMSHRYITAARKHYYDVEKLMRSLQSELGPYENWSYVDKNFATNHIDKRLNFVKKSNNIEDFYPGSGSYFSGTVYQLADSSILIFAQMVFTPHRTYIYFDVNGVEAPNAMGVDIYEMALNLSPVLDQEDFPHGISFGTGTCSRQTFNQNLYRPDGNAFKISSCLKILINNGWRAENYPIKNFGK